MIRVPTLLVFATVQPVLFVLLFTYGFGGAIHVPGVTRYIDYLLLGIVVLAIGFGASPRPACDRRGPDNRHDRTAPVPARHRHRGPGRAGRHRRPADLFVVALCRGRRCDRVPVPRRARRRRRDRRPGGGNGVAFSWVDLLLGLAVRDPSRPGWPGGSPSSSCSSTSLRPWCRSRPCRLAAGLRQGQPDHRHHRRLRALCLGGPTAGRHRAVAWLAALAAHGPAAVARYSHATSNLVVPQPTLPPRRLHGADVPEGNPWMLP